MVDPLPVFTVAVPPPTAPPPGPAHADMPDKPQRIAMVMIFVFIRKIGLTLDVLKFFLASPVPWAFLVVIQGLDKEFDEYPAERYAICTTTMCFHAIFWR
jgi:hypothetical protein